MHTCPCGNDCDCPDYAESGTCFCSCAWEDMRDDEDDDGLYDAEWCCKCECPIGVGNCPGCIAVASLPPED